MRDFEVIRDWLDVKVNHSIPEKYYLDWKKKRIERQALGCIVGIRPRTSERQLNQDFKDELKHLTLLALEEKFCTDEKQAQK